MGTGAEPPSKVTIKDVSRLAKVSLGTVSRVFNRTPNVDAALRERVYRISREIGFVPKVATQRVVMVTHSANEGNPSDYVSVMTSLLTRRLQDQGFTVQLSNPSEEMGTPEPGTIGVIAVVSNPFLDPLANVPNLPVITLTEPRLAHGFHSVRADHLQQGRLATEHLIAHGHEKIGFLAVDSSDWGDRQRQLGYLAALEDAGLSSDPLWVKHVKEKPLYDIVHRWLKHDVTAILNFNYECPLELLHVLGNVLGVPVGDAVSIVGLEDSPIYQWVTPPLTTVSQPLAVLADKAVEILVQHQSGTGQEGHLVELSLPSTLIQRESVTHC